MHAVWLDT